MKRPDPRDEREPPNACGVARCHAHFERKLGNVIKTFGAGRGEFVLPRIEDRSGQLHDVITARVTWIVRDPHVATDRRFASRRRKRRGAQSDGWTVGRLRGHTKCRHNRKNH